MARVTTIHFTNPDIDDITTGIKAGSLEVEEILDDNNQIQFGTCNSSKFSCTLKGADDLTGEEIYVYQTVDGIQYDVFTGVITSCVLNKNHIDRKLTAYDKMNTYRDVDVWHWYDVLDFPISMKLFRDSLFEFLGIEQVEQSLCNDSMLISRTVSQTEMGFETVISAICELNGCYGRFNRQGKFEYVDLSNTTITDIKDNVRSSSEHELYTVKPIDCVQLMFESGDVGFSYGEGTNKYSVVGNFLLYGKTESELSRIAVNLYSVISNIEVTPCDVELIKTNHWLKLGDRVLFTDRFGGEYVSVILTLELSGNQLINESISCDLDEYRSETTSDTESEIRKLMGKANILTRDIEQTQSTIIDVEKGLQNQITQTANSLSIQISAVANELSGSYDTYILTEAPTLYNYPAIDWHEYIYPASDTYPGSDLYWAYTYETYLPHLGSVAYVEGSLESYRFIVDSDGQFSWKVEQNSVHAYLQQEINDLQITQQGLEEKITTTTSYVTAYSQRLETCETDIKATSEQLATTVTKTEQNAKDITQNYSKLSSLIQQNSNNIALKVSGSTYEANTVDYVVTQYAKSTSNTKAPTSGWDTTAKTTTIYGEYLWTRSYYVYLDGSTGDYFNITCLKSDKSISTIIPYYYQSKSNTYVPTVPTISNNKITNYNSWTTVCPTYSNSKPYYWTTNLITYNDSTLEFTTPTLDSAVSVTNQDTYAKLELKLSTDDKTTLKSMIEGIADEITFKAGTKLSLSSGTYLNLSGDVLTISSDALDVKDGLVSIKKGHFGNFWVTNNGLGIMATYDDTNPNDDPVSAISKCTFELVANSDINGNVGLYLGRTDSNLYDSANWKGSTWIHNSYAHFRGRVSAVEIRQSNIYMPSLIVAKQHDGANSTYDKYGGSTSIENHLVVGYGYTKASSADPTISSSTTNANNNKLYDDVNSALLDTYATITSKKGIALTNLAGLTGSSQSQSGVSNYYTKYLCAQTNYALSAVYTTGSACTTVENTPTHIVFDEYYGTGMLMNDNRFQSGKISYIPMITVTDTSWKSSGTKIAPPAKFGYSISGTEKNISMYSNVSRYNNYTVFTSQDLYDGTFTICNASGTKLIFQADGNLVIYDHNMNPLWASGTSNS